MIRATNRATQKPQNSVARFYFTTPMLFCPAALLKLRRKGGCGSGFFTVAFTGARLAVDGPAAIGSMGCMALFDEAAFSGAGCYFGVEDFALL